MVGIGQTGSGKTLAFLLPALTHIQKQRNEGKRSTPASQDGRDRAGEGPKVVILAPTRELALQIQEVANLYTRTTNVRNVCCIGGASRERQLREYEYRRPELLIATPGRLNDFLQSGDMVVDSAAYVVLDEADRMLDMGFEPQIRSILESTAGDKQVLMFSATWPDEVRELAEDFLGVYTFMSIGSTELRANKNIAQTFVIVEEEARNRAFLDTITQLEDEKVLVFAETKRSVDQLERLCRRSGIAAAGIHGDKSQRQRSSVIEDFKGGRVRVMIATDVAARGLDISGVTYVINHTFPMNIENYVHRIGRTGRADNKGTSITFLSEESNAGQAKKLIKILKESDQEVPDELLEWSRSGRDTAIGSQYRSRGGYSGSRGGYGGGRGGYGGGRGGYGGGGGRSDFGQRRGGGWDREYGNRDNRGYGNKHRFSGDRGYDRDDYGNYGRNQDNYKRDKYGFKTNTEEDFRW